MEMGEEFWSFSTPNGGKQVGIIHRFFLPAFEYINKAIVEFEVDRLRLIWKHIR
jgi:hypothetical protein